MSVSERLVTPDGTIKYLFEYTDGSRVETVFFRMSDERDKDAICVSSQVGCTLNCSFCVTGTLGLIKNLSGEEIAAQVLSTYALESFVPYRKHEVAFMGMGEPLYNLDAVLESRDLLKNRFPEMRFVLSTVGVIPGIERLCAEGLDFRLQISLHASNDVLRSGIMSINRRYPIKEVLAAAEEFAHLSGLPVNINYVLMEGVNDSRETAEELVSLLGDRPFLVQLVRINTDERIPYQASGNQVMERFRSVLSDKGLDTFESVQLGTLTGGGCGQLSAKYPSKPSRVNVGQVGL